MVTYLWTKDNGGKTEYIGLNGQVYDKAPEGNDLLGLQNLAQSYIGNENEYKLAFRNNVAHLLGESSMEYETYYNTNSTCIPGIDEIRCTVTENGGSTNVQTSLVIDDDKKILYFNFYNIKGDDGECDMNAYHIYYAYANSSSMPDASTPIHSEFEEGDKWMGLQIVAGTRGESATDYNWTNIQPNEAKARFVSYAFARQMSVPGTPAGGTYDNPVPTTPTGVWHESIPTNNTASVWMTKATFEEGTLGPISDWTSPVLMSDTTSFQVEWADSNDKTDAVFNHPEYLANLNGYISDYGETDIVRWEQEMEPTCGVWSDNATTSTTYMATCSLNNGSWSDWEVVKIKGESGKDGINGGRMFMIFTAIPSGVTPNAPESTVANWDTNNDTLNPSSFTSSTSQLGGYATWTTTTPTLADGELLWMSQAEFGYEENGKIKGAWSTPNRITGKDGINGADGSGIEFIYCRFPKLSDYQLYIESAECNEMRNQESHPEYEGYPVTSRTQSDFIPESPDWQYHWTDSPLGVDLEHEIEACSTRREITASGGALEWALFGTPIVWAAKGTDGIDGDGVEYIFRITETAIETATQMYGYRELTNPTPEEEDLCREHSVTYVPTDEEVDPEEDEEYIYDSVNNKFYHLEDYSVVSYSYPYNVAPEMPPQNFSESSKSGIFGPYYNDNEEHEHIELTEVQKQTLLAYYQENKFVPGREKISSDIQNEESAAYQQTWLLGGQMTHDFESKGWCGGWVDSPVSVSPQRPFLWCATRKYTDDGNGGKSWQVFGEPFLWTQYAENGKSIGQETIYLGTLTNNDSRIVPTTTSSAEHGYPEGAEILNVVYDANAFTTPGWVPSTEGWQAAPMSIVPGTYNFIWVAKRAILADGTWSYFSPAAQLSQVSDSIEFEAEYSSYDGPSFSSSNLVPPSAHTNADGSFNETAWENDPINTQYGPWTNTSNENTRWMVQAHRIYKPAGESVWSNWDVIKCKGEDGSDGENGYTIFTSFAFTTLPEGVNISNGTPTGGTFVNPLPDSGTTAGTAVVWSSAPSGAGVVWMTSSIFSSEGPTTAGTQVTQWCRPQRLEDTANFEVMYSPNAVAPVIPINFDPDSATWWALANSQGWYDDVTDFSGDAVYMATIKGSNKVFNDNDWQVIKVKGERGDEGKNGYSSAMIYLYKRSETVATIDWTNAITYDFTTNTLDSVPYGWSRDFPAYQTNKPVYVTAASVYSTGTTQTIEHTKWATPVELSKDGADGTNGLNSATVTLYKRDSTIPSVPQANLLYTFATGILSGNLSGWTQDMPAIDGLLPCYTTRATAISIGENDTITSSEWSVVSKFVENGKDGEDGKDGADGSYTAFYFTSQKESIDLSQDTVSGGDYNNPAPTGTTPHTVNWTDTPSTVSGDRVIWMVTRRYSTTPSETGNWSSPTRMVDTVDFEAAYSSGNNDGTYNPIPVGFDNSAAWWASANTAGWYDDASSCINGAIFMATINGTNGIFNDADWNIVKVKGDKGDPGSVEGLEYLRSAFTETQIDNQEGVLLREVIGVRDENENLKAMMNASEHFLDETHGKVMFASGIDSFIGIKTSYAFAIQKIRPVDEEEGEEEDIHNLDDGNYFVTGGTYNNPLPTGTFYREEAGGVVQDLTHVITWMDSPKLDSSEAVDVNEVIVYVTNKTFYGDDRTTGGASWPAIQKTWQTGSAGYRCSIFCWLEDYSPIPPNFNEAAANDFINDWWAEAAESNWFHTPLEFLGAEAIWMATTTSEDGAVFSDWEIIRIKNEGPESRVSVSANTIIYEDGHIKTNSAEIKGTITGSNIYGGIITGATINGGSLSIGNGNFVVDTSGNFVSQNANMNNASINNATLDGNITLKNDNYLRLNDRNSRAVINISSGKVGITTASTTSITNTIGGMVNENWVQGAEIGSRSGELSRQGTWISNTAVAYKWRGEYSGETGHVSLYWEYSLYKESGDLWMSGSDPEIRIGSTFNSEGQNVTGQTEGTIKLNNVVVGSISNFTSKSFSIPLKAKFEEISDGKITITVSIRATVGAVELYGEGGEASASTSIQLSSYPFTIRRDITPESAYPTVVIGSNGIEVKTIGTNLLQYYLDNNGNTNFRVTVGGYTLEMTDTGITATNINNKGFKVDRDGFSPLPLT